MSKRASETGRKYVMILISYILKDTNDCKISQMKRTIFFIENDDTQEDDQVVPTGSVDESSCFSSESSQIYLQFHLNTSSDKLNVLEINVI